MDKKGRVYVCHTYYHVYVALLKELNLPKEERFKADLVLSLMSNDFETFAERVKENGVFENVYLFDEKRETYFPEVAELKKDRGNIVSNMINR
ncbi:MAG: lipooligosaccharide sialyltransferase, partial [Lachnospiraceae bacterium]|nr:lipooligosaccharide sialyltransferase [Lachnospiraceae bacterium]